MATNTPPIPEQDLAAFQKANPGLTFTNEDLAQYNAAGSSGPTYAPGGHAIIPTTTPVDVSTLSSPTTPFALPPAPAPSNLDVSTLPSIDSLLNPPKTQTEIDQGNLQDKALQDTTTLSGKTAAQTTAEDAAAKSLGATTGLSDFTGQLTDINNQLQTLDKQIAAVPLQVQQDAAGRGVTAAGAAPLEAGQTRLLTIKRLGLTAVAQTLQGNIASARDTATRAVDLQFAPVQAELDYLNKALELNKDQLSREDQKRADTLQVQLAERQRLLDQQKQDKTTVLGWAAEAAKNGASALTINQALALSDPAEALQLLGPNLSDPVAKQQALANLALTRANTNKTNVEAAVAADPNSKPATVAQMTYANYAPRLQSSDATINSLTGTISKLPTTSFLIQQSLPSWLQTSDVQQYNQAKANFINGVLRQESGAAISDGERKNYDTQYFPQPGDSAAVIAQKAQNRAQIIASYVQNAGSAYTPPVTGDQYASLRGELSTGEILISRSGQVGKIPAGEFNAKTDTKL